MTEDEREKLGRGLALFDFDGTLIPWDSQVLFADFVLKEEGWRRWYLPFFAAFAPCAGVLGDEGMKRVFLSYLWNMERPKLRPLARHFVRERVMPLVYPELRQRLDQHREAGHLTVLASASPDFYMAEVAKSLGFDRWLATTVEWSQRMPLFPDLTNHKGAEKVRRLSELLGPPPEGVWPRSHGYTDSTADLPMMRCCEQGTVVNPSARLSAEAARKGWDVVNPELPWKDGLKWLSMLRAVSGTL